MTTLREAAQQALEALEGCVKALDALHAPGDSIYTRASDLADRAEIALRAALAQPEREPVAWVDEASIAWLAEHPRGIITTRLVKQKSPERQMAMYAEPPRREWKSLTDREAKDTAYEVDANGGSVVEFARAIEAKLKEKNNG